jgi:hypothetical protein
MSWKVRTLRYYNSVFNIHVGIPSAKQGPSPASPLCLSRPKYNEMHMQ